MNVALSVLDLATVGEGTTPEQAVAATLAAARRAEELGYCRFWLAEHHNMPGIASSAPAVLAAAVGAATSRIRVGSGGVMLPNHAPLVVAEQFGTLEALYPGRVDLGLGRAPGTDPVTAAALRRGGGEDFAQQLVELVEYLRGRGRIAAVPSDGVGPPIWLLGSSGYSAHLAGALGMPFAFAHHFSAENTLPALELYRRSFEPSGALERPYAVIGVQVLVADTDEEAIRRSMPAALSFLRLRSGRPGKIPTIAEAEAYPWTDAERDAVARRRADQAVGSPTTVRARLAELLEQTRADELMVTTLVHDPAHRLETLERVRGLFPEVERGFPAR
jgi:luciferase family oxidoreductase group 1